MRFLLKAPDGTALAVYARDLAAVRGHAEEWVLAADWGKRRVVSVKVFELFDEPPGDSLAGSATSGPLLATVRVEIQ